MTTQTLGLYAAPAFVGEAFCVRVTRLSRNETSKKTSKKREMNRKAYVVADVSIEGEVYQKWPVL
jgi:hypothetical protein